MANIYPLNYASSEHHICRQKVFHGLNVTVVWTIKPKRKEVREPKKKKTIRETKFRRAAGGAVIKCGYKNRKLHIKVVTWIRAKASSPRPYIRKWYVHTQSSTTETKWVKQTKWGKERETERTSVRRRAACFLTQCIYSVFCNHTGSYRKLLFHAELW